MEKGYYIIKKEKLYIKAIGLMIKEKEMEKLFIMMVNIIQASGKMT